MNAKGCIGSGRTINEFDIATPKTILFRTIDIKSRVVSARVSKEINLTAPAIIGFASEKSEMCVAAGRRTVCESDAFEIPD